MCKYNIIEKLPIKRFLCHLFSIIQKRNYQISQQQPRLNYVYYLPMSSSSNSTSLYWVEDKFVSSKSIGWITLNVFGKNINTIDTYQFVRHQNFFFFKKKEKKIPQGIHHVLIETLLWQSCLSFFFFRSRGWSSIYLTQVWPNGSGLVFGGRS